MAELSRGGLDRPLRHDGELVLGAPSDGAVVLGAMQRASEIMGRIDVSEPLMRRGSGGAEVRVGPGTLWMQLALARPDALTACPPERLLNRYVRPLLRALTKVGALARYFDRDWVSVAKTPIAIVTFAHDATTGRALVEAFVAVSEPFAIRARPSYLGKVPATLAELGTDIDVARLADAVVDAYGSAYGRAMDSVAEGTWENAPPEGDLRAEPPWTATREEAIGVVAAGRGRDGRMRIGGELMVSRDAVMRLEDRLALIAGPDAGAIGHALDSTLHAPGVALAGVRSLLSLRDALLDALARDRDRDQ